MSGLPDEDVEAMYRCPTCAGTGEMESSDSTDDSWWDCRRCGGTGRLKDRRPALPAGVYVSDGQGKVEPVEAKCAERELSAIRHGLRGYCGNCRRDVEEVIAALSATDTEQAP